MNISLLILHSSSSSVLFHSRKITFTVRNCFQFTAMIQIIQILLPRYVLAHKVNELSVWSWTQNVGICCVSLFAKSRKMVRVNFSLASGVHWQLSGARGQVPVCERWCLLISVRMRTSPCIACHGNSLIAWHTDVATKTRHK